MDNEQSDEDFMKDILKQVDNAKVDVDFSAVSQELFGLGNDTRLQHLESKSVDAFIEYVTGCANNITIEGSVTNVTSPRGLKYEIILFRTIVDAWYRSMVMDRQDEIKGDDVVRWFIAHNPGKLDATKIIESGVSEVPMHIVKRIHSITVTMMFMLCTRGAHKFVGSESIPISLHEESVILTNQLAVDMIAVWMTGYGLKTPMPTIIRARKKELIDLLTRYFEDISNCEVEHEGIRIFDAEDVQRIRGISGIRVIREKGIDQWLQDSWTIKI